LSASSNGEWIPSSDSRATAFNGIVEALRRHQERISFVLVHDEEAAAFMATGHAKSTGRLGVCLATSGPGGIHMLNGLYDAKLDHQPVLALTGTQETQLLGTGYMQEVHLEQLFEDVARYDVVVSRCCGDGRRRTACPRAEFVRSSSSNARPAQAG
jgi:thiamine pyrophosphate-dependent acetolactate synthase large subunit-like protein